VDSVFGRRTDRLPSERHLSPRVGFSWQLGGSPPEAGRPSSPPRYVIRGGIGEFRSQPPIGLAAQARAATGLAQSSAEVFCSGAAVPTPDWPSYWADPGAIPAECASGPPPPGGLTPARTVTLLAEGFEAARAWRGSLGVEKRLTQIFRFTLEGGFAVGVSQVGYRDLNLAAAPRFTLAEEAGRPVYVAPDDIAPASGAPRFAASRVDSAFGHVIEAGSYLRSRSLQLTAGLGGIVGRGVMLQLSYTLQRARDQATGARGGATAGDPNVAEWARSDFERRHSVLATITYPLGRSVEITSVGRMASGAPFTPQVGGDVNGDGSRNDRAFVFAPDETTAVGQGMQRLLASASDGVRECLGVQTGRIAGRNSCTGPWQYTLDFQLNWRPAMLGLNRRLTVSLVTVNFLRGLDELLHGSAGARGWGLMTRPDNTLLYVTGFDPATRRYSYQVNERFGATYGSATAFRPPFQVGLQVRMTVGPDRMRQALDAMRAGGGRGVMMMGGPGGPGGELRGAAIAPAEMLNRLAGALPNPAQVVLEMRDSLKLDSGQIALLTPVRDSLAARNDQRVDSLRRVIAREGNNPERLMRLLPVLRPLFEAARDEIGQALVTVRAVLTPEQWAMAPESLRTMPVGRPFQIRGPGPGRPERP
jgi:hypothetical protein